MNWPKWLPLNDPAFRWGVLNPFGPPPPWWSDERREAYFAEHGLPWTPRMPAHQPNDILAGPWGVKHAGEFADPDYECDILECGCHDK